MACRRTSHPSCGCDHLIIRQVRLAKSTYTILEYFIFHLLPSLQVDGPLTQSDFTSRQGPAGCVTVGPEVDLVDGLVDIVPRVSETGVGAREFEDATGPWARLVSFSRRRDSDGGIEATHLDNHCRLPLLLVIHRLRSWLVACQFHAAPVFRHLPLRTCPELRVNGPLGLPMQVSRKLRLTMERGSAAPSPLGTGVATETSATLRTTAGTRSKSCERFMMNGEWIGWGRVESRARDREPGRTSRPLKYLEIP